MLRVLGLKLLNRYLHLLANEAIDRDFVLRGKFMLYGAVVAIVVDLVRDPAIMWSASATAVRLISEYLVISSSMVDSRLIGFSTVPLSWRSTVACRSTYVRK